MAQPAGIGGVPDGDAITDHLGDAWRRFEWANSEGEAFSNLSKQLARPEAYSIWSERDGDHWEASFHRLIEPAAEAQLLAELARSLGSFLDHARAALNYLTYQLALLAIRTNPSLEGDLKPDTVEFPIFTDEADFRKKNRIKKLPDEYREFIEEIQPYKAPRDGLVLLHELGREYRHRVLHTAAISPAEDLYHALIDGTAYAIPDAEIIPRERLEHGDVLMRFSLPNIDPNADVKPQIVLTVGIDHVLCRGLIGTSVLQQIASEVHSTLGLAQAAFFSD